LEDRLPGAVVAHQRAHLGARAQRLGERREHGACDAPCHRVEALPRPVLALAAGHLAERGAGGGAIVAIDEQAATGARAGIGRVGGDPARSEPQRQAELGDDRAREQAYQIRVAGDARGPGRERRRRGGGAAERLGALEQKAREPGAGEIRGCDEPVVPAADDDRVVLLARTPARGWGRAPLSGGARPAAQSLLSYLNEMPSRTR